MRTITYAVAIAEADALKRIGQGENVLYLNDDDPGLPWSIATDMRPGGTHRIDMETSVWFECVHPIGLTFRWSFDIEPRKADGSSEYHIDVAACRRVLAMLPEKVAEKFRSYLGKCAAKVQDKSDEYSRAAVRQAQDAHSLRRASEP